MAAEIVQLRMKTLYRIPGLNGAWRLMGLGTSDLGLDGKATLHLVRDWDHDAAELLEEVTDDPA
ncbi:MAG: hypothetical protein ACM30G_20365 [Micromonosporaceae bacterium]